MDNRQWTDDFIFKNFKVTGIQMPKDCSYQNLIEIIFERLKVQKDEYKLQIAYQVKEQYLALEIEDGSTLMFYM